MFVSVKEIILFYFFLFQDLISRCVFVVIVIVIVIDPISPATQRRKVGLQAQGGSHNSRRGFGANRRGLLKGGSTHKGSRGGLLHPVSYSVLKLKRGMGMREAGRRGRGVRLRGGSRMQRRRDSTEESEDIDDDDDDDEEEEDDDNESEDGDKDRRHCRRSRRCRTDDEEDEDSEGQEFYTEKDEMDSLEKEEEELEEGHWDSDPEPPVLLMSDLNDDLLRGSYLTVTLQRPNKAKGQSGENNDKLLHVSMFGWSVIQPSNRNRVCFLAWKRTMASIHTPNEKRAAYSQKPEVSTTIVSNKEMPTMQIFYPLMLHDLLPFKSYRIKDDLWD